MGVRSEFVEYLIEQLEPLGPVKLRAMFGGHGIYLDGLFMAVLFDDMLYLKTDAESWQRFAAAGSAPFVYADRTGREIEIGYWRLPDEALEDGDSVRAWAREAIGAALRARDRKKPRKPRKA